MPDISTANQTKINEMMCPICHEFYTGSRIAYFTTAGTLSSATITASDITSGSWSTGSLTDINFVRPIFQKYDFGSNIQTTVASDSTVAKISSGGNYYFSATAGSVGRVSTACATGSIVTITNIATGTTAGTTGILVLCTDKTVFLNNTTTYCLLTLKAGKTFTMIYTGTGRWLLHHNTTADLATCSTVLTAS